MGAGSQPDDWTTPGAFEVAAGVFRIPLPLPTDGLRAVNVYAIVDRDRLVMVDSGWSVPEARALLGEGLATMGCSPNDIARFLITHAHRDHYTLGIVVRREFGTRVSLGSGERPTLEAIQSQERSPLQARLEQMRRLGAAALIKEISESGFGSGREEPGRSEWESPDDWLEEGQVTLSSGRALQVVETPGHTRGHVVFHDLAAGLMFAGDHVLPTITPSIAFEPVLSPNPLGDFLGSLARVRQMPDAMLLPAHGQVASSVHARVDELIDHHGRRLEETESAVAKGADTAFEVAGQLRWTRRLRRLDELDFFNQILATSETGAHLALLVAQRRVSEIVVDDVYRYLPAS